MTADAKVGLLLGLFFIVVIAFLVNGLPNYWREEHTLPADAAIVTNPEQNAVFGGSPSEAVHRLYEPRVAAGQRRTTQDADPEVVVLDTPDQTPPEQRRRVVIPDLVPPEIVPPIVEEQPAGEIRAVAEAPNTKMHTVKSGEILPVIAKMYYGDEDGNRRVVIQKLYEVNKSVLKSPDRVRVGDKIKIPATVESLLGVSASGSTPPAEAPSRGSLGRVVDMFKPVTRDTPERTTSAAVREYVVQEGESLWAIAKNELSDGNRYREIAQLNKIKRPYKLSEGQRLNIPPK